MGELLKALSFLAAEFIHPTPYAKKQGLPSASKGVFMVLCGFGS